MPRMGNLILLVQAHRQKDNYGHVQSKPNPQITLENYVSDFPRQSCLNH